MAHDFGETHEGELVRVVKDLHPGLLHPVASDAAEADARTPLRQLLYQLRGMQITRGFTGDEEYVARIHLRPNRWPG